VAATRAENAAQQAPGSPGPASTSRAVESESALAAGTARTEQAAGRAGPPSPAGGAGARAGTRKLDDRALVAGPVAGSPMAAGVAPPMMEYSTPLRGAAARLVMVRKKYPS